MAEVTYGLLTYFSMALTIAAAMLLMQRRAKETARKKREPLLKRYAPEICVILATLSGGGAEFVGHEMERALRSQPAQPSEARVQEARFVK